MTTMRKFTAHEDSGATQKITTDTLEDAIEQAQEWSADGSYDQRVNVSVWLTDEDGERVWSGTVEAGPEPKEPECIEGHEHDWQSPEWIGGVRENPGVWSVANGRFRYATVCSHCGTYRKETSASLPGQYPQEPERVEYEPPDERSQEWSAEQDQT